MERDRCTECRLEAEGSDLHWERGRGKKRAPPHGPPRPYLPLELDRASPAFLLPPLPGVEIEQPIAQKSLLEAPAAPLPRRWAAGTAAAAGVRRAKVGEREAGSCRQNCRWWESNPGGALRADAGVRRAVDWWGGASTR